MLCLLPCVCHNGFTYSHKLQQDTRKARKGDLPPVVQTTAVILLTAQFEGPKGSS